MNKKKAKKVTEGDILVLDYKKNKGKLAYVLNTYCNEKNEICIDVDNGNDIYTLMIDDFDYEIYCLNDEPFRLRNELKLMLFILKVKSSNSEIKLEKIKKENRKCKSMYVTYDKDSYTISLFYRNDKEV